MSDRKGLGPPWWPKFLEQVRTNGGNVAEALDACGFASKAHYFHTERSAELSAQLEEAKAIGRDTARRALARAILDEFASGKTMSQAASLHGVKSAHAYRLFDELGMQEEQQALRAAQRERVSGYSTGAQWLTQQLDMDSASTSDGTTLAYIAALKQVVEAVALSSAEVKKLGGLGLRNLVLRTIGEAFKDEDDFPPFLQWPDDVEDSNPVEANAV